MCHHEKLSFSNFHAGSEFQLCSGFGPRRSLLLTHLLTFAGIRQSGKRRNVWRFELCIHYEHGAYRHHWRHWYDRFIHRRISTRNLLWVRISKQSSDRSFASCRSRIPGRCFSHGSHCLVWESGRESTWTRNLRVPFVGTIDWGFNTGRHWQC